MKARRVFVEKQPGFDVEGRGLRADLAAFLGPQFPALAGLEDLRIFNRYTVEAADGTAPLSGEEFQRAVKLVFSEPQCDRVFGELPLSGGARCFGVEYLPGQYDQRADSARQCLELVLGKKCRVRCAKFYVLLPGPSAHGKDGEGDENRGLGEGEIGAVKNYLINPVDSREVPEGETPADDAEGPEDRFSGNGRPGPVPVLEGFTGMDGGALASLASKYGLAMSLPDLSFCRDYFISEGRDPTLTEIRVLDTYWSDHCRHTTFNTVLKSIDIEDGPGAQALRGALDLYLQTRKEVYGNDEAPPRTLMDMAVIGAAALKKRGLLPDLDESKEINACTLKVKAEFSGGEEPWLLLFKNETHNHPTEIEPFGGAATCLGGAIRDPLAGRAYVFKAMRISGGGDPRVPLSETLPGKLPQIKIAREAAAGYASYGNQIGLAVGQVAEFYHPGFTAKRLELGAVIGAVPAEQVRREKILRGDVVLLIGGKTGRDGIGGATGSSKVHTGESVESAGAEVQKGNAVEERKLQRLFRRKEVSLLIKRCNDFGAGGVAVAVGELAPGLDIDLDAVPKKYAGLDGTELAISESQERMAVVTSPEDAPSLIRSAAEENLDAVVIARVSAGDDTGETGGGGARLRMIWQGQTIVDLSRRFLDSNGPPRYADALITLNGETPGPLPGGSSGDHRGETKKDPRGYAAALEEELGSLRSGSRRGLQERFDGSIGASSVLFPWGGRTQGTPECGMAALLPALGKNCLSAALMSFGFDPALTAENPYEGAKGAVKEALAKFACLGGDPFKARLSLQEYFERMETPQSWGKPAAALLGALEAQLALGVPAIGGKDSMSGSYRDPANGVELTVPPSVAVFAAGIAGAGAIRSGALSGEAGNPIVLLYPGPEGADGGWGIFRANMACIAALTKRGVVKSAYAAAAGGAAAALALMAFGNMTGVEVRAAALDLVDEKNYPGAVLLELDRRDAADSEGGLRGEIREILQSSRWAQAGRTIEEPVFRVISRPASAGQGASAYTSAAECPLEELRAVYEGVLLRTYPQRTDEEAGAAAVKDLPAGSGGGGSAGPGAKFRPGGKSARPLVLLPVFPGTNGEGDMEKAFAEAGAKTRQFVFRNRTMEDVSGSIGELAAAIKEAQIIALSGGFSAGDEPDGSGKFIANVFRSPRLAEALMEFLEKRGGLMLGICNGFQALIKLGLVPYGRFIDPGENSPTLTVNRIGRHVSRMVRTRVMSTVSPWLALEEPGTVHILPVSHGEGRLVIDRAEGLKLFEDGQVPFCYADERGEPALTEPDNPNGSDFAIEALTSPGGRILGKMGHSERRGDFVHINIPGNKVQRIFEAGTAYFR